MKNTLCITSKAWLRETQCLTLLLQGRIVVRVVCILKIFEILGVAARNSLDL